MSRTSDARLRSRGMVLAAVLVGFALSAPGPALAAAPGFSDPSAARPASSGPAPGRQRPLGSSAITADVVRGSSLQRGQTLASGDSLVSPSGQWSLVLDAGGFLALLKAPNRLNSEPYAQFIAQGAPGSRLVFQGDGNVVLYGPDNTVYDSLGTDGSTARELRVQDDGNVVLYSDLGVVYDYATSDLAVLYNGGTLLPGERLTSESGRTSLVMQSDGNLVLYTDGVARFASRTSVAGSGAVLQQDGNFVVYSPNNQPLFNTGGSSASSYDFISVEDGEFGLFSFSGDVTLEARFGSLWGASVVASGVTLYPGDRRVASNGVVLIYQTDGNLVEYVNGRAVFATGTFGAGFASMQADGNFVLYQYDSMDSSGTFSVRPVFATRTEGNPGSRLVVQSDANVVLYTPTDRAVFATRR